MTVYVRLVGGNLTKGFCRLFDWRLTIEKGLKREAALGWIFASHRIFNRVHDRIAGKQHQALAGY